MTPALGPHPFVRAVPSALLLALAACAHVGAGVRPSACVPPDAPLFVSLGELEVAPGSADTLRVFASSHPGAYEPLPTSCRPVWSLGAGSPASLDAASGVLRVAPDAPDGASIPVLARVGGQAVRAVVRVVDRAASPLAGTWTQVGETACGGGAESAPADPIRELRFRRDGTFTVTWLPFEAYNDYWGTYTFDRASGRLSLRVEHGNFVPPELDLDGRAEVRDARVLRLPELWLGSRTPDARRACGLRFERRGG